MASTDPHPDCPLCDGTGLIYHDVFGEHEPWTRFAARCDAIAREEGWSDSSSAIKAGLIRPVPCPQCTPEGGCLN